MMPVMPGSGGLAGTAESRLTWWSWTSVW